MDITSKQYDYAKRRVAALLAEVNNETATTDDRATELTLMSEVVRAFERARFPLGRPTVAELIRTTLHERDITQRQLAQMIGSSPSRVNDFLCRRAEPSLRMTVRICKALDIPITAVVETVPLKPQEENDENA